MNFTTVSRPSHMSFWKSSKDWCLRKRIQAWWDFQRHPSWHRYQKHLCLYRPNTSICLPVIKFVISRFRTTSRKNKRRLTLRISTIRITFLQIFRWPSKIAFLEQMQFFTISLYLIGMYVLFTKATPWKKLRETNVNQFSLIFCSVIGKFGQTSLKASSHYANCREKIEEIFTSTDKVVTSVEMINEETLKVNCTPHEHYLKPTPQFNFFICAWWVIVTLRKNFIRKIFREINFCSYQNMNSWNFR